MRASLRTRFLGRIPLNAGVLALGYFEANAACVAILVILSYYVVLFYRWALVEFGLRRRFECPNIGFSFLLLLLSGLCLGLAISLIDGIKKRRPSYVSTYFTSGVVKAAGLVLLWIKLVFCESYYFYDVAPLGLFISFFLYLPCLTMVYFLYRNMCLENHSNNMPQEASADDIVKDLYFHFLYKDSFNDIKKDMFYNSLQERFANAIKVGVPYDSLQKNSAVDVKIDVVDNALQKEYNDHNKKETPLNMLQEDSVNNVKKDIPYNILQEDINNILKEDNP